MTPQQILDLRIDLGLSQRAFAERLGVSPDAVVHWETGRKKPNSTNIRKLERLILTSQSLS